jgi:hypothetical protein
MFRALPENSGADIGVASDPGRQQQSRRRRLSSDAAYFILRWRMSA